MVLNKRQPYLIDYINLNSKFIRSYQERLRHDNASEKAAALFARRSKGIRSFYIVYQASVMVRASTVSMPSGRATIMFCRVTSSRSSRRSSTVNILPSSV